MAVLPGAVVEETPTGVQHGIRGCHGLVVLSYQQGCQLACPTCPACLVQSDVAAAAHVAGGAAGLSRCLHGMSSIANRCMLLGLAFVNAAKRCAVAVNICRELLLGDEEVLDTAAVLTLDWQYLQRTSKQSDCQQRDWPDKMISSETALDCSADINIHKRPCKGPVRIPTTTVQHLQH